MIAWLAVMLLAGSGCEKSQPPGRVAVCAPVRHMTAQPGTPSPVYPLREASPLMLAQCPVSFPPAEVVAGDDTIETPLRLPRMESPWTGASDAVQAADSSMEGPMLLPPTDATASSVPAGEQLIPAPDPVRTASPLPTPAPAIVEEPPAPVAEQVNSAPQAAEVFEPRQPGRRVMETSQFSTRRRVTENAAVAASPLNTLPSRGVMAAAIPYSNPYSSPVPTNYSAADGISNRPTPAPTGWTPPSTGLQRSAYPPPNRRAQGPMAGYATPSPAYRQQVVPLAEPTPAAPPATDFPPAAPNGLQPTAATPIPSAAMTQTPMTVGTPREMCKAVLPMYRIEPPDVLLIDAIHVVPRPPYHLRTLDVLFIQVQGTLPDAPINGSYPIEPGGHIKLGFVYGSVAVAGMTISEAEQAIAQQLRSSLREPIVSVSLAEISGTQQIAGQHLVGPDGTVTLGSYGSVRVVGMTIAEARAAIEQHLSAFLDSPQVSVDVYAYNSKVYYVITQGAGLGDSVSRFPVTGNETVLDAISHVNGLQQVSSKRIWIARPCDDGSGAQVLPVRWEELTAQGQAGTNYQILPGDRVFIAEDRLVAFDTGLAKLTAPLERIMGFTLLGTGTVTRLSGPVLKGGGNANSNF